MTSPPVPTLRHFVWLATFLFGANVPALAQQATPAQSYGEASPGLALPLAVESTGLKKEAADTAMAAASDEAADGAPAPWWEGKDALAVHSMEEAKPFKFGANLLAGWEYDDNVFLSDVIEGTAHSYFIRPNATVAYEGGMIKVTGSYAGEYRVYDGADLDDVYNQVFSGGIKYANGKSKIDFAVNFAQTQTANVEVGDRVDSIVLGAALQTSYDITEKTSVGSTSEWTNTEYDDFINTLRYGTILHVDHKFTPKTTLGLGGGYEVSDVTEGADSIAYIAQGRVAWEVTSKLKIRGKAGVEQREYDGGNSITAPIFSLGMLYKPGENTAITLDGYRRNTPSITNPNQSMYSTGAVASFTQTILGRIHAGVSGGYEVSDYEASTDSVSVDREDTYWFVRPNITYTMRDWATFNLYYQYTSNDSSLNESAIERNLVGATVAISF